MHTVEVSRAAHQLARPGGIRDLGRDTARDLDGGRELMGASLGLSR